MLLSDVFHRPIIADLFRKCQRKMVMGGGEGIWQDSDSRLGERGGCFQLLLLNINRKT